MIVEVMQKVVLTETICEVTNWSYRFRGNPFMEDRFNCPLRKPDGWRRRVVGATGRMFFLVG